MSFDLKITAGDLTLNNGDLQQITGRDKLIQDLLKICLTEAGSNPMQPWYGSLISKSLIGSYLSDSMVFSMATNQLTNSVENLKKLQQLQLNNRQKMSPDEQIASIVDISIIRNPIELRLFEINVKVLNRAFNVVNASFNM